MSNNLMVEASRNHADLEVIIRVAVTSTGQPNTGRVQGDFASFSIRYDGGAYSTFTPSTFADLGNGYYSLVLPASTPATMSNGQVTAVLAGSTINDCFITWNGAVFTGNLTQADGTTIAAPGVTLEADWQLLVVAGNGNNSARRIVSATDLESEIPALDLASTVVIFPSSRYGLRVSEVGSELTTQLGTLNDFDPTNDVVQNVATVGNMRGTDSAATQASLDLITGGSYDTATDNLTAIRDAITAVGVPPTAAAIRSEIDTNSTRLVAISDDTSELITSLAALNDISPAEVLAQAAQALVNIQLNQLVQDAYDPASPPGNAASLLNSLVEDDGGVPRFTVNALEQAPSGGGGGGLTSQQVSDAVWQATLTDYSGAVGSTGEALATNGGGGSGGSFTSTDRQTLNTILSQQITSVNLAGLSTFDPAQDSVSVSLNGIPVGALADDAISLAKLDDDVLSGIRTQILDTVLAGNHDIAGSLGALSQDAGTVAAALTVAGAQSIADSSDIVLRGEVDASGGPASTTAFKTDTAALVGLSDVEVLQGRTGYFKSGSVNYLTTFFIQQAVKTDGDTKVQLTVATSQADGRLIGSLPGAPVDDDVFVIIG